MQCGPCIYCGETEYPLSQAGPIVCPACIKKFHIYKEEFEENCLHDYRIIKDKNID